jgi:hypothetical protein
MINIYKLINFEIKTEITLTREDFKSIKDFDDWYENLTYKFLYYKSKENGYSIELRKIINIQSNILSEVLFIIKNYGNHQLNLIK